MLDQSSVPGLKELAEGLSKVLPDDGSRGDPEYLARSALDICLSVNWNSDDLFVAAVDCARRYWAGQASEDERERVRGDVVNRAESVRKAGRQLSPEWCKYALAMSALDVRTPSSIFAADYLMDFSLKAGVPITVIRRALEAHVPGLSEHMT
jgi:hypothetical protein